MNNKKPLEKVCIDCINSNQELRIGANFKVAVEYGKCDCCGKMYIVVPFLRFFSKNVVINPHVPNEDKPSVDVSVELENMRAVIKKQNEVIHNISQYDGELREMVIQVGKDNAELRQMLTSPQQNPSIAEPLKTQKGAKNQKPEKIADEITNVDSPTSVYE